MKMDKTRIKTIIKYNKKYYRNIYINVVRITEKQCFLYSTFKTLITWGKYKGNHPPCDEGLYQLTK